MKQYKEADVVRMAINPLRDVHKEVPQWKHLFPNVAQLKYLAWAYDPYSPLVRTFHDPEERKKYAAELSGCTQQPTPEMVFEFCTTIGYPTVWKDIVALEAAKKEYTMRILKELELDGMDEKKASEAVALKMKLAEGVKQFNRDLKEYYEQLFAGDLRTLEQADVVQRTTPESRMRKAY